MYFTKYNSICQWVAKLRPELSPRLLAIKITDEEPFSVSEAAVYRVLKKHNLIEPRPLPEMPAAKSWRHKTTRPDEIWQCDATNLFITGWGYYKLIPVQDDYSRKIERFNRSIKGKLCLVVYCSPEELKKATDEAIAVYNATPHESLQNVYPNDVYAGRGGNIRKTKGEETLDFRKTEAVQS